jgi:hypothetical protein
MRHHAARAGLLIDGGAGLERLVLRDKPVLRFDRGRVAQDRNLGVAVQVKFFDVIVELQVVERLFLARQLLVPAPLTDRYCFLGLLTKRLSRVSSPRRAQ